MDEDKWEPFQKMESLESSGTQEVLATGPRAPENAAKHDRKGSLLAMSWQIAK